MSKVKKIAGIVLSMVLLVSMVGCSNSQSGSSTIKIGFVAPLTGTGAAYGEQMLNGAKLAAEEINSDGGINGKKITIVAQDDKSDPKEAANIANKFANDSSIVAVLGNYNSSCGLSGAPIYEQSKKTMIHVGTSPEFTKQNYSYLFRISVTDAFQGEFVSKWMDSNGYKKISIFYENDDYGRGLKDVVTKQVTSLGGKVVNDESYMLGETKDYTSLITNLKKSGADALFIGGLYTEAALIAKQMKQLNVTIPVYGTDGIFESEFIKLGGDSVEGIRCSGLLSADDTDEKVKSFISSFNTKYKYVPGTYAAYDYDATKIIAEAIKSVGTDSTKIKDYIAKNTFEGVTGSVSFNTTHDATRTGMKKMMVKNGEWALSE